MMHDPTTLIFIALAYLIGSIPFGLIIGRLFGAGDVRTQGSGNIGATNVLRLAGKKAGILTLILDMAKGGLPALVASFWFADGALQVGLTALAGFIGHLYPIFLGFKGGKGVATGLGGLLGWVPLFGLLGLLTWLGTAFITRISSLSALVAFAVMPLLFFMRDQTLSADLLIIVFITNLIFWRHRSNIKRIINNTESRIGKKG
ncbi:MAG: glycerol-3-phosphate 1-O-acyltransferase PlsY [Magnetococcales bacterium]|nr:glycerol-3-phosphate 1-O-acyltransferase PlsY [Magnetococcales bacterium]